MKYLTIAFLKTKLFFIFKFDIVQKLTSTEL